MSNYEKYLNTDSGKQLFEKYSKDEIGIWQVFGEDPNCDFSGCHSQPSLGFYDGFLQDIVYYAVDLPNFWSWGGGGDFKKVKIETVAALQRVSSLQREKQALLDQLADVKKLLGEA